MISKDIVDYIKAQIEKRISKEEIRNALVSAGWQTADIGEAFKYAESGIPLAPIPRNMQNMSQPGQTNQNTQFLASPTDLLREAWGIYKTRFKTFLGIILVPVIIFIGLGIILLIALLVFGFFNNGELLSVIFPSAQAFFLQPPMPPIAPPDLFPKRVNNLLGFGMGVFIFIIPIVILQIWSQAAMLFAVKDSEENIGVKEAYKRGWKKIGSMFWVGLLSGIIVFGGYLLFVIPGIIFGVWFSLAAYIVIAEGSGGMIAILKSKEYVKGYWWKVLWRFIFIGLVVFGINIAVMLIGLVIPVLPNLLMIFITPLAVIYSFLVYKNLKAIKEAKGEVKSEFSSGEKIKFIIVGILGVLLFIGLLTIPFLLLNSNSGSANKKAMDYKRQYDIEEIRLNLDQYRIERDIYPALLQQLSTEKRMIGSSHDSYLIIIPKDPKTNIPYEYRQLDDGKDYELCVKPENSEKKCFNSVGSSNFTTK